MVSLSASLICADMLNLEEQVRILQSEGISFLHLDVGDGHFVSSFGFCYETIFALHRMAGLPLDIHLAVDNPDRHLGQAAEAGADMIAVPVPRKRRRT